MPGPTTPPILMARKMYAEEVLRLDQLDQPGQPGQAEHHAGRKTEHPVAQEVAEVTAEIPAVVCIPPLVQGGPGGPGGPPVKL